jgi:multiple sugar transport system permease protein
LGYFGTFWRVVVPNSLGFVAAIGTITVIGNWNAFL